IGRRRVPDMVGRRTAGRIPLFQHAGDCLEACQGIRHGCLKMILSPVILCIDRFIEIRGCLARVNRFTPG
ncbi:MAG: hypothetical protein WBS20_00755, partial [Lysobacterales bacterium]